MDQPVARWGKSVTYNFWKSSLLLLLSLFFSRLATVFPPSPSLHPPSSLLRIRSSPPFPLPPSLPPSIPPSPSLACFLTEHSQIKEEGRAWKSARRRWHSFYMIKVLRVTARVAQCVCLCVFVCVCVCVCVCVMWCDAQWHPCSAAEGLEGYGVTYSGQTEASGGGGGGGGGGGRGYRKEGWNGKRRKIWGMWRIQKGGGGQTEEETTRRRAREGGGGKEGLGFKRGGKGMNGR